ncbi:hypothetical protein [Pontibacter indicus]|uniref:Uncharacterized protein n=1 Tax=Pontibacter indicus TaxID=1317125 RepID=A0A1R3XT86_9BACT|nr:hypothetical protein [Pontibacter indicus]SIT94815.1 hypothetical protein SAMN05444128_3791 [Pontibacter indicus]
MKQFDFTKALLLIFLMLFTACNKDAPVPVEPYTGNGYIKGNLGLDYLNYTEPLLFHDGDSSSHYYNPNINGGLLMFMRGGKYPDERIMTLIINGIDLDKLPIPTVINSSQTQGSRLQGALMLRDFTTPDNITIGGPEDSYNFEGQTHKDITIRITSKANDIIAGSFEGKIKSGSGLEMAVTEGEFRIKIVRKE